MSENKIKNDEQALKALQIGVNIIGDTVGKTLGPKGRNVVIRKKHFNTVTKDGVTVAMQVFLEDPYENAGAQMVKEVALKTNQIAGDGPQPLYSKVLTPKGFVNMGDLQLGQEICGTNGTFQKVVGIYPKGLKKIVKLTFSGGRVVECCEDHLWSVTTHYGSKKIITAKEILDNGVVQFDVNQTQLRYKYFTPVSAIEFNSDLKPIIDPYFLGLLIGDGSLSGTGSIELSLGFNKEHVLEKIICPEGISFVKRYDTDKKYIRVKFNGTTKEGKNIAKIIDELGLLGVKSETKFIPKSYLYSSIENRNQLLQGLSDTDGYLNQRGLLEYSTISEQLHSDVVELFRGLGKSVFSYLKNRNGDSYSMTPIYSIAELKGYKFGEKILAIDLTDIETEMQCIKVSNLDNLYITDGYVVTHNTTTATVLAQAIVNAGIKNIAAGANPMDIKRGIELAVKKVVIHLKEHSLEVGDDYEKIKQIGTISANNDEEIGELIASTMEKIGRDGVIYIEESRLTTNKVEIIQGVQINQGYISPYFVTDSARGMCVLENPVILLYDGKITSIGPMIGLLDAVVKQEIPILIIADDVDGETLASMIANKNSGLIKGCCIRAPFGENSKEVMKDIALSTGAVYVTEDTGMKMEYVTLDHLGRCEKVIISNSLTTIIGGAGDEDAISEHILDLKTLMVDAGSQYEKDQYKDRIAKLSKGVAVLYVGGHTETEVKEKKDRVEDALNATRAAVEEGIIPGGGVGFLRAIDALIDLATGTADQDTGIEIITKALHAPIRQICLNGALNADLITAKIIESNDAMDYDYGFNARTETYGNLIAQGVIDPTKVARVALENAASVATLILTTSSIIID